jgi:hypothetical protein
MSSFCFSTIVFYCCVSCSLISDTGTQTHVLRDMDGALCGERIAVPELVALLADLFPAFSSEAIARAVQRLTEPEAV